MATVTHHNKLLTKLAFGDIVSNEFCYHKNTINNCYVEFNNSYARAMNQPSESEIGTGEWIKPLSLNKILCHIIETERSNAGSIFMAKSLEDMYKGLLNGPNINHESHITCFVERILLQLPI